MKKRMLALLLTGVMVLSLLTGAAFAADPVLPGEGDGELSLHESVPMPAVPGTGDNVVPDLIKIVCDSDPTHTVTCGWDSGVCSVAEGAVVEASKNTYVVDCFIAVCIRNSSVEAVYAAKQDQAHPDYQHSYRYDPLVPTINVTLKFDKNEQKWNTQDKNPIELHTTCEKKNVSVSVPFTVSVQQKGSNAPDESTTFSLGLVHANVSEESYADVTISGSVTTGGTPPYTGNLTIAGPVDQVRGLLSAGVFIQQVDGKKDGWTYDDIVWALVLEQDSVATVLEDNQEEEEAEEEEAMVVKIHRASCEDTPNGPAYNYDPENFSTRMTFTNTYEKHEHDYDKKFDNKNHWDECDCGDKQNTEAHKLSDWKVTREATAATKGEKTRECTVDGCDYKETAEVLYVHTHAYTQKFDTKNHWDECACGDKQNTETHKFTEWKVTREATDKAAGEKTRECTVCDYEETEKVPYEHTHDYTQKYDTKNHWDECACGDKQNTEAHKFTEWKVTREATDKAKGEKTRECTVCDYKESVEIPALKESPNTGDGMSIGFWLVLTLASGCALTGVLRRRKHA